MNTILRHLKVGAVSLLIIFSSIFSSTIIAEVPESKEPIKLAINEWAGQHITTHIAGEILKRMGYEVEYVTAGYIPQFIALRDGSVTATLEIWESSIADAASEAVATGKVEDMGSVGLIPIEGWYYPDYVAEICPGLPDWEALNKCAQKFGTPDTFPLGRLVDYPADWVSRNDERINALNLKFKSVKAGSEGALIASLKAAVTKKEPIVMMFYSPHWVMSVYPGNWIQFPEYGEGCFEDKSWGANKDETYDCGFANNWINKFAWVGMKDKWPSAHKFLQHYQLSNADQESLLLAVEKDGKDLEQTVTKWVDENQAVWNPWVKASTE